jgi:hypothetical protein
MRPSGQPEYCISQATKSTILPYFVAQGLQNGSGVLCLLGYVIYQISPF